MPDTKDSAPVANTMTPPTESAQNIPGCLYLVATPIGNLEDISMRALRILREVDLIACEDTRQTRKLLSHFGIETPIQSYHEHNEASRAEVLAAKLEEGAKIALVTDAGTPVISDPGYRLVKLCVERHIPMVPIPGPSAVIAALAASGLFDGEFTFIGFLPARTGERRKALQGLKGENRPVVFFEAPHRLLVSLQDVMEVLGNREAVVAREITKLHEEFLRGHIAEILQTFDKAAPRGEITIVLGPPESESQAAGAAASKQPIAERVAEIMREKGVDQKNALKQTARERGLTRREAYRQMLATKSATNNATNDD